MDSGASTDAQRFLDTLGRFARILTIKLYRLRPERPPEVPILPCLDHEAMVRGTIDSHAGAYVQDASGDLHEVVYVPDARRIDIDVVSTSGENSAATQQQLVAALKTHFPGVAIRAIGPSWLRGDARVVSACRAQVTLRDVLLGSDLERTKAAVDRLATISTLMEKESRVASWGARTVMAPLVAVAGFLSYQVLGTLATGPSVAWASWLRYGTVTAVGAFFLYYGLRAVHLTGMANRVWKRSAEYGLILGERKRLQAGAARPG